jgi:hypothetical protein
MITAFGALPFSFANQSVTPSYRSTRR